MSLLTAVGTASVFALFGFPFQHYQCWFSFSRLGTLVGMLVYLALAGGGVGLLSWAAAAASHAEPTASPAVNGVLYGISGALAARADFGSPSRATRSVPADQLRKARSALAWGISWSAGLLDSYTYRKAEAWLLGLTDQELVTEAWRIQAYIAHQPASSVNDRAKKKTLEKLVPAMERLARPAERTAGRAHLVSFCASFYREEHLPRPPLTPAITDPPKDAVA